MPELLRAMRPSCASSPPPRSLKPTSGCSIRNSVERGTTKSRSLPSQFIPGYPATPTGGNSLYMQDLIPLDSDMSQYIHDNTEDELTHEVWINNYLVAHGAAPANLDQFRTLPSSKATGANQIGRLTNLMQLTVDTSWWTRYRSRTKNPDFGDTFL